MSLSLLHRADRWLARRVTRRLLPLGQGPGVLSISFDDAPASACRLGRQLLEDEGALGTWYIAGGLTDRLEQGQLCHAVADLQSLAEGGHELGCHTFSHRPCALLSPDELLAEIRRNADFFIRDVGVPAPRHFSFPLGDYGVLSKRLAAAHFDSLRLTRPGIHQGQADLNGLYAQALYADGLTATGLQTLIEQTAASGGWLILYTHAVAAPAVRWGCTPTQLTQAMRWARQAGCDILPVGQAVDCFKARAIRA